MWYVAKDNSDKELDEGRRVRLSTVRFVETKASRKRCLVWYPCSTTHVLVLVWLSSQSPCLSVHEERFSRRWRWQTTPASRAAQRAYEGPSGSTMDKLADIWREWSKDDVENGTAPQWPTVEEQIEVQRVMRPKLAELP